MDGTVNADFSLPVRLSTAEMAWEQSPAKGVWRRKLDRLGIEQGWTTSIVRYEPGCSFPSHPHPRGEEFFVLEGVFSDEWGDYPAGTYVRNPPGSHHAPFTREGCTIFVKLCQFFPGDDRHVRLDTRNGAWRPGPAPGLEVLDLHQYSSEQVALVRWAPNTRFSTHVHPGGEEVLVLEGTWNDDLGEHPVGTWLRQPRFSRHSPWAGEDGALILVKVGHLP